MEDTSIKDYCAKYFFKAKEIAKRFKPDSIVCLQFFQREDNVILGGINESLKLLKLNTNTDKYRIRYLEEGTIINAYEPVLELEGPYHEFAHIEGVIDGVLARISSIATNTKRCKDAARGKEIIFMGDRSDHFLNHPLDGYAVGLAGIKSFSTLAQAGGDSNLVFGSMPHAIIQIFKGDLISVLRCYRELFPDEELIALVDFNGDVIGDSLKALREFGRDLKGVRVDTSKDVVDDLFKDRKTAIPGISPTLIKTLRERLDQAGGKHVKITVSSGFDPERIDYFEAENTPVDSYGVGEYILKIGNYFSADAVKIDGTLLAKRGRGYKENKRFLVFKT